MSRISPLTQLGLQLIALFIVTALLFLWSKSVFVITAESRVSADVSRIQAAAEGYLETLMVNDGDHVTYGDIIAEVDAKAQIANVALVSAKIDRAQIDLKDYSDAVLGAQVNETQLRRDLSFARQQLQRVTELRARQSASQQELDREKKSVTDLETRLKLAGAILNTAEDELAQAMGDDNPELAQLNSELTMALHRANETKVLASATGIVQGVSISKKEFVERGDTLASIVVDGTHRITAYVAESDLEGIVKGSQAWVSLFSQADTIQPARVVYIARAVEIADLAVDGQIPKSYHREGWVTPEKMFEVRLELAESSDVSYFYGGRARVLIAKRDSPLLAVGRAILWIQAKLTTWF